MRSGQYRGTGENIVNMLVFYWETMDRDSGRSVGKNAGMNHAACASP